MENSIPPVDVPPIGRSKVWKVFPKVGTGKFIQISSWHSPETKQYENPSNSNAVKQTSIESGSISPQA